MRSVAPLLEALGCAALLAALPATAHADNCSDPPRLQSNGTFSAPGPDCSRTDGFKTGTKNGDIFVRGGVVTTFGVFAIRFLHGHRQLGYIKHPDGSRSLVVRPGTALDRYLRGDHSQGVLDELRRLDPRFRPGPELLVRPHGQGPLHPDGSAPDGQPTTRHETIGGTDVLVITPGTAIQVDLDDASHPPPTPPAESSPPPVPSPSAEAAPPASDSTPPDSPASPAPALDPAQQAREVIRGNSTWTAEEYEARLKEQWKRAFLERLGKGEDAPEAARFRALEEALYGGQPPGNPEMQDPTLKAAKLRAIEEITQEVAEQRRQQDINAGKTAREALDLFPSPGPGPSQTPRPPGGQ